MSARIDIGALTSDYMKRAGVRFGSTANKTVAVTAGVLAVASFATMASAAYTADHIKKSSKDMSDPNVKAAYQWSWITLLLDLSQHSKVSLPYKLNVLIEPAR
jgi:hypothetical protein